MRPKIYVVLVLLMHTECRSTSSIHLDHQSLIALEERGRKQLETLEEKTHHPHYGQCWMQSLTILHDGCRMLSDAVHVDIALRFTNCFLEMSGQENLLECLSERTDALKRLCMSQMTDRTFTAYTEFFTQTQNMCYFLQNQNWHQETERTINRLSSFSQAAGEQLVLVNHMQDTLLHQQHEQYRLQAELLLIGRNLSISLDGSQSTLQNLTIDLKRTTEQHSMVLEELFSEFHQLHRWIVGRYAFVDGLLFYCAYITLLLILTSLKRTAGARWLLLASFMMSMCLESCLYRQNKFELGPISLDYYRWLIRQLSSIFSFVALLYQAYKFTDFSYQALGDIREQNRQILEYLVRMNLYPIEQWNRSSGRAKDRARDYRSENGTLPMVMKQNNYKDHEHATRNVNLRRSVSRISTYIPTVVEQREPSLSSESVESRSSRYNLRRKSMLH